MKKGVLLLCLLLVFSVQSTLAQNTQAADEAANPLLRLLHYVPNTPEFRAGIITYGDVTQWAASWGFERVSSLTAADALEDERVRGYWLFLMPRQAIPADALGLQYFRVDDQLAYYGFDFASLDRVLAAGQPPMVISVAEFSFDPVQIADALSASGYETQPLADDLGTLYSVLDDYEIDVAQKIVKTRTGQLGGLNRIALLEGGQMIIAKATEIIDAALGAAAGKPLSLAEDPFYKALATALTAPEMAEAGQLVGALLLDGTQFGVADPIEFLLGADLTPEQRAQVLQKYQEEYLDRYPLPPFVAAAFATYHTPGATYLVLALVFPPGTEAAGAALQGRFENYTSLRWRTPIMEVLEGHNSEIAGAVDFESEGFPVTALLIRSADPGESFIPGKITAEQQDGTLPFEWLDMIYSRDTGFLASTILIEE